VTLRDVAQRAGVSPTTASFVLAVARTCGRPEVAAAAEHPVAAVRADRPESSGSERDITASGARQHRYRRPVRRVALAVAAALLLTAACSSGGDTVSGARPSASASGAASLAGVCPATVSPPLEQAAVSSRTAAIPQEARRTG